MLMISGVQYTYSMDIQIYGKPVLAAVAEPVKAEPSAQDDTDALLIDHEYRITL